MGSFDLLNSLGPLPSFLAHIVEKGSGNGVASTQGGTAVLPSPSCLVCIHLLGFEFCGKPLFQVQ